MWAQAGVRRRGGRPLPRDWNATRGAGEIEMSSVAAIVLAAGRSRRFQAGEGSKLLALLDGTPLVRLVTATALSSRAAPTVVVTGHAATAVETAVAGLPVRMVHNPDYRAGMAGSLAVGLAALPAETIGALILLADMPLVRPDTLDQLIAAFESAAPGTEAVVPLFGGRGGNPVLLGRSMFPNVRRLEGDDGARKLLIEAGREVATCVVDDPGIAIDVDTRDALRVLQARD